jgi:asparagine synthase (glutamine-hydrolysing)
MCGICGFASSEITEATLRAMNARLRARGPDEAGYHIGDGVGLAMRRLCVIDPPGGSQPMANEDRTIRVVFNGEIYNFRELRGQLANRGHRFHTRSDTEVIIHGYEEWGDAVTDRLNGMFAFAIHDARDGSWLLARDRMGQKPLYYHHRSGLFAFASQPGALLEHPGVRRGLDAVALAQYLAFEYVPAPRSLFDGVQKLPPAHRMRVRGDAIHVERYWHIPTRDEAEPAERADTMGDAGWIRDLRARLGQAVESQLVSDVPVGCFLSGGLDSSVVAVLMAERVPAGRLSTFCIGFSDRSFDESAHAAGVARHIGTDHHVQMMDAPMLLDLLPEMAEFMDEPLGDGSVLPTFALSRFARGQVTVALTGDGGDELLGGYPTLWADRWAKRYARWTGSGIHAVLTRAAALLPLSLSDMSFDFKVRQFLRGARLPAELRHFAWIGSFLPGEIGRLLAPDVRDAALGASPYDPVHDEACQWGARVGLDRLLYLYARFYLADDVLVKVDRTTMACGLEARAPFLDPCFVQFCSALPNHLKIHGSSTKVALRRAFEGDLPAAILARPKKGFGMPIGMWLRGPLRPILLELLAEDRLRRQGIFDPSMVARMCDEHVIGRADHRKQLWTLLAFQLWHDRHLTPA